jgi:putative PEP-CTERM system histidine kinase
MSTAQLLFATCAVVYAMLCGLIAWQVPQRAGWLLAGCCATTAGWAAASAALPGNGLSGLPGALDLVRALAWFGFILHLYRRYVPAGQDLAGRWFALIGLAAMPLAAAAGWMDWDQTAGQGSLWSLGVIVRLGIAVCTLLLIENVYFNVPETNRWHVALPCVLLGGLACFDVLICADAVLFRESSGAFAGARVVAWLTISPLLVVAAARDRRWRRTLQLSRTAVFHSATLILSGVVLLALSLAGEVFRRFGAEWGWLVQVSLVFAGLIGLGVMATSGSARSVMRRVVVQHFFATRYDYQRQWLACIDTLSGDDAAGRTALHSRVIQAMADVVDSPGGALFLRDAGQGAFQWAGSWNLPATTALPADHPAVLAMQDSGWIVRMDKEDAAMRSGPVEQLGRVWLGVPLAHGPVQTGVVLLAPPRAPFKLDQEVFDLLRIVGREVATYVAEQRATRVLLQTRQLHDYGKRFAFVAHDIKNVSSQLSLLLSNAERHIANPEFQRDMLDTIGASVAKITHLIRRLDEPLADRAPAALAPLPRLEELTATYRRIRKAAVSLEHDGSTATVAMAPDAFDTAVTHLLNNAVEAAPDASVLIRIRHEVGQVVIDIVDKGPGMSEEFIRDGLFRPFGTSKRHGSGIGAFQARELVREGGGDVQAISLQAGSTQAVNMRAGDMQAGKDRAAPGTTMRITLPRADGADPEPGQQPQLASMEGRA